MDTQGDSHSSSGSSRQRRIVVLISGSGTNLQALINASSTPSLPRTLISLVLSNRKSAYGLLRAQSASPPIPTAYLGLQPFLKANPGLTRVDYDIAVAKEVLKASPDVVVLAGWMHILSKEFLDILNEGTAASSRTGTPAPILNLHPALPGAFDGANAVQRAFDAYKAGTVKGTGVMVHRVVPEVDRGEPVVVREVEIMPEDTLESLEERIHAIEHVIIVEAVRKVLEEEESAVEGKA